MIKIRTLRDSAVPELLQAQTEPATSVAVSLVAERPTFSVVAPASTLAQIPASLSFEPIEIEPGRSLAASLNDAARRALGEYFLLLPYGGTLAGFALQALLEGWTDAMEVGGASCSLVSPDGSALPNGFLIVEDQLDRVPLLQSPATGSDPLGHVSSLRPDLMLVRPQAFWSAGGFAEEVADSLLAFELCLRIRALGWRFAFRRDLAYCVDPRSPTARGVAPRHEDLQSLMLRWHEILAPDALRTPDGAVRIHPRTFGFGKIADFESFAETRAPEVRSSSPRTLSEIPGQKSAIRTPQSQISVVVTAYNSMRTIGPCVQSVLRTLGMFDELILVDNASRDETPDVLRQIERADPRIRVILNDENLGFSGGTNTGIRAASGEFIVLLNPDTEATPGWLGRLRAHFADPKVAAVGPTSDTVAGLQKVELHMPHGATGNFTYDTVAEALNASNARRAIETKLLIGFCIMFRRSALDEMGLLDEELFLGMDDLDLSWRLRLAGYRLLIATDVFAHHEGQASFKSEPSEKVRKLNQESTDALGRKLLAHYGPGNVPSSYELWDMTWFIPSFDVWAA